MTRIKYKEKYLEALERIKAMDQECQNLNEYKIIAYKMAASCFEYTTKPMLEREMSRGHDLDILPHNYYSLMLTMEQETRHSHAGLSPLFEITQMEWEGRPVTMLKGGEG